MVSLLSVYCVIPDSMARVRDPHAHARELVVCMHDQATFMRDFAVRMRSFVVN